MEYSLGFAEEIIGSNTLPPCRSSTENYAIYNWSKNKNLSRVKHMPVAVYSDVDDDCSYSDNYLYDKVRCVV